jgi:hypothetical protein
MPKMVRNPYMARTMVEDSHRVKFHFAALRYREVSPRRHGVRENAGRAVETVLPSRECVARSRKS